MHGITDVKGYSFQNIPYLSDFNLDSDQCLYFIVRLKTSYSFALPRTNTNMAWIAWLGVWDKFTNQGVFRGDI